MITREQLEKALKKNSFYLVDYILNMQKELEEKKDQLFKVQQKLVEVASNAQRLTESPEYVLGQAVAKYVNNTIEHKIANNIGVEIEEKWDAYDEEQTRPDYEANVYYKEDEQDEQQ